MSQIKIYARVRPTRKSFGGLHISPNRELIGIKIGDHDNVTKRPQSRYSHAPPSNHTFKFSHVFDEEASQESIFKQVACHMIDSFLAGYNGTIFAYGQTASGKTHTIEGNNGRFSDRGLIPRTISYVYKELERRNKTGQDVSIHISYMEIYQDTGFDLLNPGTRPGALMVTLPKVHVTETRRGEIKVRNLSLHLATSEDMAMKLLFQGSTCRKVAETSMNQCSSRSHSIFTIILTVRSQENAVITRSKLNLVDLAGSERVAKTKTGGRILQEAKHINLSLHHLEHVIVTLQQFGKHGSNPHTSRKGLRSFNSSQSWRMSQDSVDDRFHVVRTAPSSPKVIRKHVPYRNCMLTMVLKDSLGGNCLTAMIATISAEEKNIWESISTCRFSQRVACISNIAKCNEELDDKVVIKKLKQRVLELEAEMLELKKGNGHQPLEDIERPNYFISSSDQLLCHNILYKFIHGKIDNPVDAGIDTPEKFNECLLVLRKIVMHALGIWNQPSPGDQETIRNSPPTRVPMNTVLDPPQSDMERTQPVARPLHAKHMERSLFQKNTVSNCNSNKEAKRHLVPVLFCGKDTSSNDVFIQEIETSPEPSQSSERSTLSTPGCPQKKTSFSPQEIKRQPLLVRTSHSSPREIKKSPLLNGISIASTHNSQDTKKSLNLSRCGTSPEHTSKQTKNLHRSLSISTGYPNQPLHKKSTLKRWSDITPLSTSRLSSGFGSLQDEGSNARLDSSQSPYCIQIRGTSGHSVRDEEKRKRKLSRKSNESENAFPMQAWSSPVETPVATPKRLSENERLEQAVQKLMVKKAELLQSQVKDQNLEKHIRTLNLRIKEDLIMNQLSEVKENLAQQHFQVKTAEMNGADEEEIYSEKIAEQQLRIKKSKIYQKLLDVQSDIQAMEEGEYVTDSHQQRPCPSLPPTLMEQGKLTDRKIKKELEKHQSLVDREIEELKTLQMEKDLELKEAATIRKIQALKHQLTGYKRPVKTSDEVHYPWIPTEEQIPRKRDTREQEVESNTITENLPRIPAGDCDRESYRTPQHVTVPIKPPPPLTAPPTMMTDDTKVKTRSSQHEGVSNPWAIQKNSPRDGLAASANGEWRAVPGHSTIGHMISPFPSIRTTSTNSHVTISSSPITPRANKFTKTHTPTMIPVTQSYTSSQSREKLTLPKEVKEREYMTTLQRQKARVSKIRRCMVAATVIQRAWRDYRQRSGCIIY